MKDEAEQRGEISLTFEQYIRAASRSFEFYDHVNILIWALEEVVAGRIKRLMLFMPPRHGKSELVSRLFPGYYLRRHPNQFVGLLSYGAELAYTLSKDARDYFKESGGLLAPGAKAVKRWNTLQGGGMWASGVGGPITGLGYHVGIIDDPIKNDEDASSDALLSKQWEWWKATFMTRTEPGAAIIHLQTRWNQFDLAGMILDAIASGELTGPPWHVIDFEAIKTDIDKNYPESCIVYDDERKIGTPLCPERMSLAALQEKKSTVDTYWWNALYQQRPTPLAGAMWQRDWFREYDRLPTDGAGELLVHSGGYDWDTAFTKDEKNAATAYIKSYRDDHHNIYIEDVDWRWVETPDAIKWMLMLGGPHYIENKASGKSIKPLLDREGVVAIEVDVASDKIARTRNAMPTGEAGKIYVNRRIIKRLLDDPRQGILSFPNSRYKDVNDAFTQCIARHRRPASTGQFRMWNF